jgi:hypothetical protein
VYLEFSKVWVDYCWLVSYCFEEINRLGEIILRKSHDLLLYITKQLPNMININFDSILRDSVSKFIVKSIGNSAEKL